MLVAASTRCFPELSLNLSLKKLADLEYTNSEIGIGNQPCDLKPEWLLNDLAGCARLCLSCRQIIPSAFFFDEALDDPRYREKFEACCKLAKMLKVITIVIRSSPLGIPYNEEIERLRRLARFGLQEGLLIGVLTETDHFTDTPESICCLCKNIPEIYVTLDPSYFIFQQSRVIDYDSILEYVCHVRLRDTTEKSFQVQIGQGVLEYGRLVVQLNKANYHRDLCADLAPLSDINQESELRKMRLLLESIL